MVGIRKDYPLAWQPRIVHFFDVSTITDPDRLGNKKKINFLRKDRMPADHPGSIHLFEPFLGQVFFHDAANLRPGKDHPFLHQAFTCVRFRGDGNTPAIGESFSQDVTSIFSGISLRGMQAGDPIQ